MTMFVNVYVVFIICISIWISNANNDDYLDVELVKPNGKIRGHVLRSAKAKIYYAFQEIPYGNPPVGEKRFEPPEFRDDWDGIRKCTKNTKICHQFGFPMPKFEVTQKASKQNAKDSEPKESEDCLYLNVYTPVKPGSNNSLSVYFFIHGGAFALGDATFSSLGPKYLIDGNIVIVTANYRLGALGFLSTGNSAISGNMGLKDQHLALQWTRKNIHLFGGNPLDIVLGGESVGSYSVGYHLLSPRTNGLVKGYIQQSGSHLGVGAFSLNPRKYAFELGRALSPGVSENSSTLVCALRKATAEEIVIASESVSRPAPLGFMPSIIWAPVIEGENNQAFITSSMYNEMMKGNFNRLPSLIGFNSEESLFFLPTDEHSLMIIAAMYDANPSMLINPAINVENRTLVGEKVKKIYTSSSFQKDLEAFVRFTSDVYFIRSAIRQAELTSRHVPVYLYQLSAAQDINAKYPGVAHILDMRYFMEMPPLPLDMSPVDEDVREVMLKLWWNFIKFKNPTPERDPVLQNIEWPTVGQKNIRYLNLNKSMRIETNPRNYNDLKNVLLEYMNPPYHVF